MLHLSMQTYIATIVQQHTVKPVMLAEAFLTIPGRLRIPPLRTALGKKVEHNQISGRKIFNHLLARIRLPCLSHPDSFRICLFHCSPNGLACSIQIDTCHIASFVEGVHAIKIGFAVKTTHLLIIKVGNFVETWVAPQARIGNIQPQTLFGIVRNHARITRQYRPDAIFTHTLQDLFL